MSAVFGSYDEQLENTSSMSDVADIFRTHCSLYVTWSDSRSVDQSINQSINQLINLPSRRKAAQQENHKLEEIQRELGRLDNLLTADVQVIRTRIEDASRHYMDAQ